MREFKRGDMVLCVTSKVGRTEGTIYEFMGTEAGQINDTSSAVRYGNNLFEPTIKLDAKKAVHSA